MKRIDVNGLKTVQMDLLTVIDKFCEDNNIRYSISDGTLIGAVRHGGFIPWDDDIDISMPREDYERFETLFPPLYKGYIQLNSIKRTSGWMRSYAVISDERTVLYEDSNENSRGIGIDLFPVDDVPDSDIEWRMYYRKLKWVSFLHNIKLIIWKKERGVFKNLILILLKVLLLPMSTTFLTRLCDIIARENNGKNYQHCYQSSFGVYGPRPFSKYVLQEYISIKFEDRTYKCYKNYDNYLANTYGDYMTPPPVSAQVSTHDFEAYWRE